MVMVKFPKWMPDRAPIDMGATNIKNVIHTVNGYEPIFAPEKVNPPNFFGGTPRKLFIAKSSIGITMPIVMGSVYSARASSSGWITLGGSGYASETWEVVPWGDVVYAVNGVNTLQRIEINNNGNFSQVAVPNQLTSRFLAAVENFLMMADVREFGGNTRYPYRLRWSGLQRPEMFVPDPAIQSDFQDIEDIGQLRGLTGGDFAFILGEFGTSRGDYVGPDAIFKFTTIERNLGCEIPNSVLRVNNTTYWWSPRGWRASDGGVSVAIGEGMIDNWFRRTHNPEYNFRMSHQIYIERSIIVYSFVSMFSVDNEPDMLLAYNWVTKAWTYGEVRIQILGFSSSPSVTTDDAALPLEGFVFGQSKTDFYSNLTDGWGDERQFLAAMVEFSLARMTQSGKLLATLEIQETQFNQSGLSIINKMMPIITDAIPNDIRLYVTGRDVQTTPIYRNRYNLRVNPHGIVSCRLKARYHRVLITINGTFNKALGIDFLDIQKAGYK